MSDNGYKITHTFSCNFLISGFFYDKDTHFLWAGGDLKETLKNEQIVLPEVRLIGPDSEQLGLMSSAKALEVASSYDLDLVLIAPDAKPPVCKVMDYGKYRFDELKKLKDQKKSQKVAKLKEMPLSMTIDDHDLEIKAKQVCKFLADGSKVKVNIRMKGRMQGRPQVGVDIMTRFAEMCASVGQVDKKPEINGRNIFMFLAPISKK
ncbi:MAG: translation initiation factor IF-3 [Clostridiales bacterium]|nr:translation initiation factor IF-3 [Clostridiales bacterium]